VSPPKPKEPVRRLNLAIEDLVPPLQGGDYITAVTEEARSYLPKTESNIHLLASSAKYVGAKVCQTGWQLFGVDIAHFRKATPYDIAMEITAMSDRIHALELERAELKGLLKREKEAGKV
jgi:hypothetical protein